MEVLTPTLKLPSGHGMPVIGFGTSQANDKLPSALEVALECGYRHIDTAFVYKNEDVVGQVLKQWFENGKLKREDIFITTKLPPSANHEHLVGKALDLSLSLLQLDYIDLYLVHFPAGRKYKPEEGGDVFPMDAHEKSTIDPETDIEAVWRGMEAQVDAGKAKAIGLSNFNIKQTERIVKACRIHPSNLQVEVYAYFQQKELRKVCQDLQIPICAYGPLGAPYLNTRVSNQPPLLQNEVVLKVAREHNKTCAQVLLRYLVQLGLIVIPKSVSPQRIKENFELFDFELTKENMNALEGLDCGEEGRVFHYLNRGGIHFHPEFPYPVPSEINSSSSTAH